MFKKILVANRGEIALRVIRACREMGITTVAVYSAVDRGARHVQAADEAVYIGPAPPLESYLAIGAIVSAAAKTGAEAIHPGYGFLSENAEFARACENAGLTFIGPRSEALALVGDKVASRKVAAEIKAPLIPGMMAQGASMRDFERAAAAIGYPVLIKASGGGGGKGMHVVHTPGDLRAAVETSRREARSAFGNDAVYLEKYLGTPRHVEFQVLADQHGNAVHVFERECSIQRRHQKILEETPSPALDDDLRRRMGATAVALVKTTKYTNAGTVEFLLDENRNYYFLEVNARIQVEHPVTEMVAGIDLVHQQLRIAAGEPLAFGQDDLMQRGHAIECRIYAEDPARGFLPSPGKILLAIEPSGPGIRCDSGIYSGMEVPPHYDPILSKLIVWAENREGARRRMIKALKDYVILGIPTTAAFLADVLDHPEFTAGRLHTHFVSQFFSDWKPVRQDGDHLEIALIAGALASTATASAEPVSRKTRGTTPWQALGKRTIGGV